MLKVSIVYFSTGFPSVQADQIERLGDWQIPPSRKSGNNKHSPLSKSEISSFKQDSNRKYWSMVTL